MLPKKITDYTIHVEGVGYAGRVVEFSPPEMEIQTEEFRGGGMDAPAELDMGMNALTATFTIAEHNPALTKLFGTVAQLRMTGVGKSDDISEVSSVVWYMRGKIKKLSPGDFKAGDQNTVEFECALLSVKQEIDGETVVDIDVPNYKRIIGGVDQLEEMRNRLGM